MPKFLTAALAIGEPEWDGTPSHSSAKTIAQADAAPQSVSRSFERTH